jgi:hypothetical protein
MTELKVLECIYLNWKYIGEQSQYEQLCLLCRFFYSVVSV